MTQYFDDEEDFDAEMQRVENVGMQFLELKEAVEQARRDLEWAEAELDGFIHDFGEQL